MSNPLVLLSVDMPAFPLVIAGSIAGRPVFYRARGGRWELYEGREADMSGVDADDHLTGQGVRWLAGGVPEDDQSVDEALGHVRDACSGWLPAGEAWPTWQSIS